jgi:hypothetical protein
MFFNCDILTVGERATAKPTIKVRDRSCKVKLIIMWLMLPIPKAQVEMLNVQCQFVVLTEQIMDLKPI